MEKLTNAKWYTELTSWMFRIFIVLTFFFPMYYSDFKKHMYYIGFLWPYAFLFLGMGLVILKHRKDKWEHKKFAIVILTLLIVYAAMSLYVNKVYHHWMWEEIHNCVAFVFMLMLLVYPKWKDELDFDLIRFLLGTITLSMVWAIVFYKMGYAGVQLHNNQIDFKLVEDAVLKYNEKRLSWIYYHKSQFALMQLVFMGFAHRFKDRFKNRFHYVFAQLVFLVCLVLSHSWTAFAAMAFLVGGICLDALIGYVKKKQITFRWKYVVAAVLVLLLLAFVAAAALWKMSQERNLLTLGSRIPIWSASLHVIAQRPMGVGTDFGKNLIDATVFTTNNCHNVFLNAIYRFSIPVGVVFILVMLGFIGYMLFRQRTWFGVGYVVSLMMMLSIDYSLLSYGVAQFILLVYLTMEPADLVQDQNRMVAKRTEDKGGETEKQRITGEA